MSDCQAGIVCFDCCEIFGQVFCALDQCRTMWFQERRSEKSTTCDFILKGQTRHILRSVRTVVEQGEDYGCGEW
jgi:hypothetical protein